MFGDTPVASGGDEAADPRTPSEETTSDAAPDTANADTEADESDAGAASDTPPSEGTPPDAAASASETAADDDPFKDTTAATYVVNGQSIPVEDIRVFKEGGAVIRPEALPNVLSKLAHRDTLERKEREASQQFQTLAKATEWTDSEGKQYTGPEAAIQLRIGNAALFAENALLVRELIESQDLQSMLTTAPVVDAQGRQVNGPDGKPLERVVFRREAIDGLRRESSLQKRELEGKIRDHYKGVLEKAAASPVDYTVEAPLLIAQVAKEAKLDPAVLTPQDRETLADLLPDHVKDGEASVKWQKLATRMMQDRAAQKASTTTLVSTTAKATKEAANRMAAAARGVKPKPGVNRATSTTTTKPAPPTAQQEREANEGAMFDSMLSAGASAMRAAR